MRFVSTLALAALLGASSIALVAPQIAHAQDSKKEKKPKKGKEAAAPKLNLSKPVIEALQAAEKAMTAKDFVAAKSSIAAAKAASVTPDDQFQSNAIELNLGIASNDNAIKRSAIKGMLASGKTDAETTPKYYFFAGEFAREAKDYDDALAQYRKALDTGYQGPDPHLWIAEMQFQKAIASAPNGYLDNNGKAMIANALPSLQRAIQIEQAAGKPVPAAWFRRGFSLSNVARLPVSGEWGSMLVRAEPTAANWSEVLNGFLLSNTEATLPRRAQLDLFRLMSLTNSVQGRQSYAMYFDIAYTFRIYGEAKDAYEKARTAGTPLVDQAEDYKKVTAAIPNDRGTLAEGTAYAPRSKDGVAAAGTANAYLGYGDFASAIPLYRLALEKGGVDSDEVNTRLGIALARSGDAAGAKAAFAKVQTGSRKNIAEFWSLWLDTRGTTAAPPAPAA